MEVSANSSATQPLLECDHSKCGCADVERGERRLGMAPPPSHLAAMKGNVSELQAMPLEALKDGGDFGVYPLHLAAAHGHLPVLDLLVNQCGVDINMIDDRGRPALMHGVAGKSHESIVWLAKHGANLEMVDEKGWHAVHWAADSGSVSIFAVLANLGANMEPHVSGSDITPLKMATEKSNLPLVEYMVLVRGSSQAARSAAVGVIQDGPCKFWINRCLEKEVGCHDRAAGDGILCGPTSSGFSVPLASRLWRGPDVIHHEPRQMSLFSAGFALVVSVIFWLHGDDTQRNLCLVAAVFTVVGAICWFRAVLAHPGSIDTSLPSLRERYVAAMEHVAAVGVKDADQKIQNWWGERLPVIHELQVIGPARSKYCKTTRACVPLFDHYCAFLRNTVGQENYGAFMACVVFSFTACICLVIASVMFILADQLVVLSYLVILNFGAFAVLWFGLIIYHLMLARLGLTTNEMIDMKEKGLPTYLTDMSTGEYANQYDKGCIGNCKERLHPTNASKVVEEKTNDAA